MSTLSSRWRALDRRLAAMLALALAAVVGVTIFVVIALPEPQQPPPATGAAALVPSDALAYVSLSTDRRRPAVVRALALARLFPDYPLLSAALTTRFGAILAGARPGAPGPDLATEIGPWLGNEAAFALLNTPGASAGSMIVLDVRRRALAQAFLADHAVRNAGTYRGVDLLRNRGGTALAFVGRYLVLGQRASVRAAIDVKARRVRSLRSSPAYDAAASGAPADRFLDAYISAAGDRRLLAPRGGILGAVAALLDQPALSGTAISVSARRGMARVRVHSALDPALVRLAGPPPPEFTPTLAGLMPSGSTVLLDVRNLARAAPAVLGTAAAAGIGQQIGPLLHRLGQALSSEGVDVGRIVSLFSGETALAVSPTAPGRTGRPRGPALVIVTRTSHQEATRELLAGLQGPLAQLFPPPASGPGAAPEFNDVQVAGVPAHQLSLAPGLQLDYAVFHGLVVVSTSLQAIGAVARHPRSLDQEPGFQATLGDIPDPVTSLLFLDFSQLLDLGKQTGLERSPRVSALRPDLQRIRAIGLASTRGENDTTAELLLQIK